MLRFAGTVQGALHLAICSCTADFVVQSQMACIGNTASTSLDGCGAQPGLPVVIPRSYSKALQAAIMCPAPLICSKRWVNAESRGLDATMSK